MPIALRLTTSPWRNGSRWTDSTTSPRALTGRSRSTRPGAEEPTVEEVDRLLAGLQSLQRTDPDQAFLRRRGIDYATYQDWRILDNYEVTAGVRQGRPRIKRTTIPEMMDVIHQGR